MQKCHRTDELHITLIDQHQVLLQRCCASSGVFISVDEFLSSSINDLGKVPGDVHVLEERKNGCSNTCHFLPDIKKVCINAINVCNIKCYHCSVHCDEKGLKEISFRKKSFFKIINIIKNANLESLAFDGTGEIFLFYKDLISFLRTLTPKDTKDIRFMTNGTLLNENRLYELYQISKDTGVNYRFGLSVDGVTKETYEKIRVGAKFEHTLKVIQLIQDIFKNPPEIIFTIKKYNIEEVSLVKSFFNNLGCNHIEFLYDIFDPECSKYMPEDHRIG